MKRFFLLTVLIVSILLITACENTYITSAKVYIQQQQYDKAIEMCETAVAQTPSNPDAYFILGKAHSLKGNYREMNDAFDKSLALSPKNENDIKYLRSKAYSDLFNSASQLSNNKKYDEAIEKYEVATIVAPKRHEAYMNLAVAYLQLENDSMAVATYQRASEAMPDSMRFPYNMGLTYYNIGQYENSITAFTKVIDNSDATSKLYLEALFNMANAYAMLKQEDKALDIYQKALDKDPENTMILYNMARMFIIQEKYAEAIDIFKKVLAQSPDDFEANIQIGNAYLQINNKLIDDFNKNLKKLSEKETKERKDMMDGNFKASLPYFEKCVELNPDNASAWFYLGTVYVRLGETEKGTEAFAKHDELKAKGN
ncbi:tetratricopeptide repeat protein [bacterium]|nr:tetratricopeptide repeat protein [bacterium]